jgi:flagellar basal-body rod modification protein FlgD
MSITPVQLSSPNSTPSSPSGGSQTDNSYSTFLQLLTTEMKYQDPLKPVDPTQTVTQLATFSAVEQAVKTNDLLSSLLDNSSLSQAASLIGRTATSADGKVSGVVKSITNTSDGMVATLADGERLTLSSGVTIS